jgi:hypothetical protein
MLMRDLALMLIQLLQDYGSQIRPLVLPAAWAGIWAILEWLDELLLDVRQLLSDAH